MDRLEYHKQRLDQALGFKRDENYVYEIGIENDAFVPESTGIVPEKEEKGTEFTILRMMPHSGGVMRKVL